MSSISIEPLGGGPRRAPATARHTRFFALIDAHTPTLEAVARRLDRDPASAADLVQDTLERAWRHLDSLECDDHVRGWLVRIMRNTWIDQLRRRRAEVSLEEVHELPAVVEDEPSWWAQITVCDLRQAIEQLAEPFRSAAALHDLEGHAYRDIARLLGIPNATAATRLHRAHRQLWVLLRRKLAVDAPS